MHNGLTSFQQQLDPRLLDGLRTLYHALHFSDGNLSENNHFGTERVFMVKANLEAATFQLHVSSLFGIRPPAHLNI